MKLIFLLTLFISTSPLIIIPQASSQSDFKLQLKFDKQIPVVDLDLFYFKKAGNRFDKINFSVDSINNQITLYGTNNYVLYVTFPTIVFQHKKRLDNAELNEAIYSFYLVSGGALSSYTGQQSKEVLFSYANANITLSLEFHNHNDTHKVMDVKRTRTISGYENKLSLSNERIKIKKE